MALTDGQMAFDETVYEIAEVEIVWVPRGVFRNLRNQTENETHIWLAFGAPPV